MKKTNYYLRYTVNYTRDVDLVQPVDLGVWTTPNCATFYDVYRNDDQPEDLSSTDFKLPVGGEIVLAIGHQHVGAINISMYHNGEFVCASYPRWGAQEGVAGDERGYLVEMSVCLSKDDGNKTLRAEAGDTITIKSYYYVGSEDPRIAPLPGGTHLNVMGYMYVAYVQDSPGPAPTPTPASPSCTKALDQLCGDLVGLGDVCNKCAEKNRQALKAAKCTVEGVEAACAGSTAALTTAGTSMATMLE